MPSPARRLSHSSLAHRRLRSLTLVAALAIVPSLAHAQAEPAPESYVPPGHERPPPPPSPYRWHVGVDADLVVPLAPLPPSLPQYGWGAGVQLQRALVDLGRLRFGLGATFAYRRVQHDKTSMLPYADNQQFMSHMTFAGLLILDGIFGRMHPWLGAGAGVSVAQYRDPAVTASTTSVDIQSVLPLVQIALGLDVEVWKRIEVGLAGELDPTFSSTAVGTPPVKMFAPGLFVLRAGVGFRF
jgi:hypothetical protein